MSLTDDTYKVSIRSQSVISLEDKGKGDKCAARRLRLAHQMVQCGPQDAFSV